ncbi:toxic anion resistance protein, partial [Bacillus subtilis]|uniref:toxic anion resistance protein n=1 Tax=Bacillus subtilis TaxID=1423 RepID=UPI001642BC2A
MITIGILKKGIIQGVRVKGEKVVADWMSEVEGGRNEMVKGNGEKMWRESVEIGRMGGRGRIDIERMEWSWKRIVSGMEERKEMEE